MLRCAIVLFAATALASAVAAAPHRGNQLAAANVTADLEAGNIAQTAWAPTTAWTGFVQSANGRTYGTCASTAGVLYAATAFVLYRFDAATGNPAASGPGQVWLNNTAKQDISRPLCVTTATLPDTVFIAVDSKILRFDSGVKVWQTDLHTPTQGDIALLDSQQLVFISTLNGHTNALKYADGSVYWTFMGNWYLAVESNPLAFDGLPGTSAAGTPIVAVNSGSGTYGINAATGVLLFAMPFAPGQHGHGRLTADVDGPNATGRIVLQTTPPLTIAGEDYTMNVSVLDPMTGALVGGFDLAVKEVTKKGTATGVKKAKHAVAANGLAHITAGDATWALDLRLLVPVWKNEQTGGHAPALHLGLDYRVQPTQEDKTLLVGSGIVLVQASTGFIRHGSFDKLPPATAFPNCSHVDHYPTVVGNRIFVLGREGCLWAADLAPPQQVQMNRCSDTPPLCQTGCGPFNQELTCRAVAQPSANGTAPFLGTYPNTVWEMRWCVSSQEMRIERRVGPTCNLNTARWYAEWANQCEITESGYTQVMTACGVPMP